MEIDWCLCPFMRNRLDESRVAQSLDGGPSGGESACPRARDIYVFRRPPARADQGWGRENGYRTTRPGETWTVPFAARCDDRAATLGADVTLHHRAGSGSHEQRAGRAHQDALG